MSKITNEIIPEVNKIYKAHFTFAIENFATKFHTSCLHIPIPGLTTCHLEVHPNHHNSCSSRKSTKLVFRMDAPIEKAAKKRTVKLELKTSVDICYWIEEFAYNGVTERVKEEFLNTFFLKGYLEEGSLILNGLVVVKEMGWQEAGESLVSREMRSQKFTLTSQLHSLVSSGTLSDFTFIVGGRELDVHKAILAARSPVFNRMFTGNFSEATSKRQEVKDIDADTFEEFLYFIYTGDLRNEDFPVEDLIAVADRYEVADLMNVCETKLLSSINENNAEFVFRLTNRVQCNPELKKISFEVLQAMFDRFTISLPKEFLSDPDKVFHSIELKKNLEQALSTESSVPEGLFSEFSELEGSVSGIDYEPTIPSSYLEDSSIVAVDEVESFSEIPSGDGVLNNSSLDSFDTDQ